LTTHPHSIVEKEQIGQLYDDLKLHYEQQKQQVHTYQRRLGEEIQQRKEIEINFETRLGDSKRLVEMKQREIDQLAQKLALPIDTDILRMKIMKDVESRHRIELDQKASEIERLQDQYYEAKRQLDIARSQLDSFKYEAEKDMNDIKEKLRSEINELLLENQTLHQKCDDRRDRDLIKQLRRDLEEAKRRAQEANQECNTVRRERDSLKVDKNDQFIAFNRQIEELKNKLREQESEVERCQFKCQASADENQKMHLKMEKKSNEVHQALTEKVQLENIVKSKDQMIDTLNRQINQLREDLKSRDLE
jgi:chromosome segregation ATPase